MSHLFDVTHVSDAVARSMWKQIDWKAAQEKLQNYQRELTLASENRDTELQMALEEELVGDLDIRCLAVKHVRDTAKGPGVDRIRWRTDADCFRAAYALTADGYRASALRQVDIVARNSGKTRHISIPTYRDKAMAYLYHMVIAPKLEAQADSGSFAFRRGRSAHDALALLREMLTRRDAPELVVETDATAYYSYIMHDWAMKHIPMNKTVLHEQLKSGVVYAGRLFERGEEGISESSSLSTEIANHMLNGLQGHIYKGLHGTREDIDFAEGSLVRFADDIIVTARSYRQAERILRLIEEFFRERGLVMSREKTGIHRLEEGFTFLSETFQKVDGQLTVTPARRSVERFILRLQDTVEGWRYSHEKLIEKLNHMLTGWANYHRYYDAAKAFEEVDFALLTMLLRDLMRRNPNKDKNELKREYFCRTNGTYQHCKSYDPSVRVMSLRDVVLVRHKRVRTSLNAYRDLEYLEKRVAMRDAQNVAGAFKGVWKRQGGKCAYCGCKILVDQAKALVTPDPTKPPSLANAAYVHVNCLHDEHEIYETYDPLTSYVPFDTIQTLKEIIELGDPKLTHAKYLPEGWKYMPLKKYFAELNKSKVTLSFEDIETIIGDTLPLGARNKKFWYARPESQRTICRAWTTEDYEMEKLDLAKKKVTFKRCATNRSRLKIPRELTDQRIPDDAIFELDRFFKQIIRKYCLAFPSPELPVKGKRAK